MDDIKAECILKEQVHVKEEEDNIKEEPEWEDNAGLHGISAAAARAGLYANHEVKDELVLGPVGVQPPDIAFTLYACQASAARAQPVLRDCVARPETHVANNADVGHQVHSNANIHTEKQTYICDVCNKRFALKTRLVEHVMIHMHQEPEQEEIRVADNACQASAARAQPVLRDCVARPERHVANNADVGHQAHSNANIHREKQTYICDVCNKRFALKTRLVEHVMIHMHKEPEQEEIRVAINAARAPNARQHPALRDCAVRLERLEVVELGAGRDGRLASRAGRDADIETEIHGNIDVSTEEETYICDTCNKRFALKSQLVDHVMSHIQRQESRRAGSVRAGRGEGREPNRREGREPTRGEGREPTRGEGREPTRGEGREPTRAQDCRHACLICYKDFTRLSSLKRHERIHRGEKPFSCGICKQQLGTLKKHERTHTGQRPFSCGICQKKFTESGYLNIHKRTHTGERGFSCGICQKKFIESGSLKRHERTHTGEKPFACDVCKKQFTQLRNLKKHKDRFHADQNPFCCDICQKRFAQKTTLVGHIRRHARTT